MPDTQKQKCGTCHGRKFVFMPSGGFVPSTDVCPDCHGTGEAKPKAPSDVLCDLIEASASDPSPEVKSLLMPCPFCEGAASVSLEPLVYTYSRWRVQCNKCQAEVHARIREPEDKARELWNRRPETAISDSQFEALKLANDVLAHVGCCDGNDLWKQIAKNVALVVFDAVNSPRVAQTAAAAAVPRTAQPEHSDQSRMASCCLCGRTAAIHLASDSYCLECCNQTGVGSIDS